jgi:hypothetical protein
MNKVAAAVNVEETRMKIAIGVREKRFAKIIGFE